MDIRNFLLAAAVLLMAGTACTKENSQPGTKKKPETEQMQPKLEKGKRPEPGAMEKKEEGQGPRTEDENRKEEPEKREKEEDPLLGEWSYTGSLQSPSRDIPLEGRMRFTQKNFTIVAVEDEALNFTLFLAGKGQWRRSADGIELKYSELQKRSPLDQLTALESFVTFDFVTVIRATREGDGFRLVVDRKKTSAKILDYCAKSPEEFQKKWQDDIDIIERGKDVAGDIGWFKLAR